MHDYQPLGLSAQRLNAEQRALSTGTLAEVDRNLIEWDNGEYEGRRSVEIHAERPDWQRFRDGCPGGESSQQIAARADRVVNRLRALPGNVLLFSSGHFLRVLAAGWCKVEPTANARSFMLDAASLSALGYEHRLSQPVIRLWNDSHHLLTSKEQKTTSNN